jgi:hypothetical protein
MMAKSKPDPAPKPEKPPAPPPSTWRVTLGSQQVRVTAIYAAISTHGALTFKDASNQLVKGFAFGEWSTVEMVGDSFGNALIDRAGPRDRDGK